MPIIINYFYFFVFLYLCAKGVGRSSTTLTYLDLGVKRQFAVRRGEYLIYFLLITSLFAFYAPGLLDLAAVRLLMTQGIFILMLIFWGRGVRFTGYAIFYMLFLWWCFMGWLYTDYPTYAPRTILKYIYPLLLFFMTSTFIQDERLVLKISQNLRKVAYFSLGVAFIPYAAMLFRGVFYYGTAIAIHYIAISSISFATYLFLGRKRKELWIGVLFMIPCIIWTFRTSLLANVVMMSVFSVFLYKLRAVFVLAIIGILGVCAVFYIPSVKEKMFADGVEVSVADLQRGEVSMKMINSNGRFAMWEDLTVRFYKDNELMGSGTGSVQGYMYSNRVFGGLTVPHNDYVPLICDNGLIGLSFYILAYISMLFQCFIEFNRRQNSTMIKYCAIIAASTTTAVLCSMYTENTINYSVATFTPPIAFYGMMMGLKWQQNRR